MYVFVSLCVGELEKEVIVNLEGGLGNQLFQWAFGRSVSLARKEEVLWCKKRFDTDPLRSYSLDAWKFSESMEFVGELEDPVYPEPVFQYDPGVYTTPAKSFTGHRQTEKYFREDIVRSEMLLKAMPSPASFEVAEKIVRQPSAFLHIRRTDNLTPTGLSFHGIPGDLYYGSAINRIREQVERVHFFVFSDDPEWCRSQYAGDGFTVVGHNKPGNGTGPGQEHEDIWLMSLCQHAIIANSTFSWWGAWLGDNKPERIVICPQKWFNAPTMVSKDICPERWIRI